MLLHEESCSAHRGVFLIRSESEHQVPLWLTPIPRPLTHQRQHDRDEVLHVDRTTAPQDAVADLAAERVHGPNSWICRYYVEMTMHEDGRRLTIAASHACSYVATAGRRFQHHRIEASVGQGAGHVLGGCALSAVTATAVRGVEPDQVRRELRDLGWHGNRLRITHSLPRRPQRSSCRQP